MTNENPRGLPVVSPWDVLDAATRGEEWVTFGELKRAREQLATDYAALQSDLAAAIARAEAAERNAERLKEALHEAMEWNWLDDDARPSRVADFCDSAIAAQQAEGEA